MISMPSVEEMTDALLERAGSTPMVRMLATMMFVAAENEVMANAERMLVAFGDHPTLPMQTAQEVVARFRRHNICVSPCVMDKYRAAAEMASQQAVAFWLAIELAPKDGTRVLIGRKGFYPMMASWPKHLPTPQWPKLISCGPSPKWELAQPTHFAWINEPEEST